MNLRPPGYEPGALPDCATPTRRPGRPPARGSPASCAESEPRNEKGLEVSPKAPDRSGPTNWLPGSPDHRPPSISRSPVRTRAPNGAHSHANPEKSFVTSALAGLCPPYTFARREDPDGGVARRSRARRLGPEAGEAGRSAGNAGFPPRRQPVRHRPDHTPRIAGKCCMCRAGMDTGSSRRNASSTTPIKPSAAPTRARDGADFSAGSPDRKQAQ